MKQFFGKKKLAKLVTLSVMAGAMLGVASGVSAADYTEVINPLEKNKTIEVEGETIQNVSINNQDTSDEHSSAINVGSEGKNATIKIFQDNVPGSPDGVVSLNGYYYGIFTAAEEGKENGSKVYIDGNQVNITVMNCEVRGGTPYYIDNGYGIMAGEGGKVYINQKKTDGKVTVTAPEQGLWAGRNSGSYIAIDGSEVKIEVTGSDGKLYGPQGVYSGYDDYRDYSFAVTVQSGRIDINQINTQGKVEIKSPYDGLYARENGIINIDGSEVKITAVIGAVEAMANSQVNINQNNTDGVVVIKADKKGDGKVNDEEISHMGVEASGTGAKVKIGGSSVTIEAAQVGSWSYGLYADDGGEIEVTGATSVSATYPIIVYSGGKVAVTGVSADKPAVISGDWVYVSGAGSVADMTNVSVDGTLYVEDGGTINITDASIIGELYTVGTINNYSTANFKNTNIRYETEYDGMQCGVCADQFSTVNIGTDRNVDVNISVKNTEQIALGALTSNNFYRAVGVFSGNDGAGYEASDFVNGKVNIKGDKVTIKAETVQENETSGEYNKVGVVGIYAQSRTADPETYTDENRFATVNIDANETHIELSKGEWIETTAITNLSQGRVYINGGLYAVADTIISTRGFSKTVINKSGEGIVQLQGDIEFNYDAGTSGSKIDAEIDLSLTDSNSYWEGKTVRTGNPATIPEDKKDVYGMKLTLKNGATWTMTGDSFVNNLIVDGSTVTEGNGATYKLTLQDGSSSIVNGSKIDVDVVNTATSTLDIGVSTFKGIGTSSDVIKNTGVINLIAGTFDDNFVSDAKDTGTLNLVQEGVYKTTAINVYTNSDVTVDDAGEVTAAAKAKINFIGGTLALMDNQYTLNYAKSAQTNMGSVVVGDNNSQTKVVMLGNPMENSITVDEAAGVGNDVALDKVEATTQQKNLLVGSGKSDQTLFDDQYVTAVEKGFNVKNLDLEVSSAGMIITNNEKVTLGGTDGGNLVKVGGEEKSVKVVVGVDDQTTVKDTNEQPITDKKGILNIGNFAVSDTVQFQLKGSLTVNKDSEVNVKGQTEVTENINLKDGNLNVAPNAVLTTPVVNMTGENNLGGEGKVVITNLFALDDSSVHVGQVAVVEAKKVTVESTEKTSQSQKSVITGKVTAESLQMKQADGTAEDKTVVLNVGTEEKSAVVDVKTTELDGNMLFLDPAWVNGVGLEGASHYATETTNLDGAYVVGRNSILTFGATNADADALFGTTDFDWGENEISAAAYVAKNINVTNGSLMVDGSKTQAPPMPAVGSVNFAANSLFMVNGDNCRSSAAVTGVKSAIVADSSKLFIANAEPGKEYTILLGTGIESGWLEDNVSVNGLIENLTVELDETNKTYFKVKTGEFAFNVDDTVMPNVGTAIVAGSDAKAKEALKALVDNPSAAQQTANVNAYANMGENLGVTRGAYDVANMVGNAVTEHWENNAKGENIWAVYTHSKNKVDGMELGGMDANYDAQYNGVVVGADLGRGFGIALNYADGNVSNGFGGHNDAEYYGAGLYARKAWGNFSLNFDAGYTHGKNELSQNGIEADAKTDTISAGLTAKYLAKAGKYDKIGLFAGARYMHIDGKDYTDSLGVNREADKINSVVVPVGLEYTGEFKMAKSAWTFKPVLAVGYLFNLGDRENDMTMRYGGAEDIFGYDFVDDGAFFTHAGMDFAKKNFTLGISYDFMKSKNSKNNRWNVNANVAF